MPQPGQFPDHIGGFIEDASTRFAAESDNHHHYFQVVCPCGERHFEVLLSKQQSVKAECPSCKRSVTVYDLDLYPAASKADGPEIFERVTHLGFELPTILYVMYEYGQVDEGEAPDPNDVSWCQIWMENRSGDLLMILDDETS